MKCITCKPTETELGFAVTGPLLAIASLLGAGALSIFAFKSPSPTQRIQLEQLKKEQVEIKRKSFIQKVVIIGGVAVLILVGLKQLRRR